MLVPLAVLAVLSAACAGCSSSGSDVSNVTQGSNATQGRQPPGGGNITTTSTARSTAGAPTCTQLTPADVQPLMTAKARAPMVTKYGTDSKGQQCVFPGGDDQNVDVTVALTDDPTFGYDAAMAHAKKLVPVSGVGDEAFRETGNFDPTAKHGGVICSVTAASSQIPGASTKLIVNGYNRVSEAQDAVLSQALGTLCNRIFGSGNTTIDLSHL